MPDPIISAIDRLFDLVDNGVEKVDHFVNRVKRTDDLHHKRVAERAPKAAAKAASTETSVARRPGFRLIEATDAQTGQTIFVVTNGTVKAECIKREDALELLRRLEATP